MDQQELVKIVKDFLNNHRKAVFAILDEQGLPTTSLMLYVIDDEMNLYFGTCRGFSKYDHLKKNPIVSLSVIQEVLDPLQVVDLRGEVTEVPVSELVAVHQFFKSKNPSKYYVENAEDFVMFKLKPTFVRWLDAKSGELSIVNVFD